VLALLPLCACTYAMEDFDFRTKEGETAFDRAVQSVETNCWGTKIVDKERALIYSKWQAWHTGDGVYLSRCLVSMMPDSTEKGGAKAQDVRLSFAMRKCPLADVDDLDKLAETCTTVFEVPAIIADQVTPAARRIVADITR
jgi:hypothetical protein